MIKHPLKHRDLKFLWETAAGSHKWILITLKETISHYFACDDIQGSPVLTEQSEKSPTPSANSAGILKSQASEDFCRIGEGTRIDV